MTLSKLLTTVACVLMFCVFVPTPTIADQAHYIYDDLGRLSQVIDGQGNVATYQYDAVGNLLSITRNTGGVEVPVITAFTPNTGSTEMGLQIEQLVAEFVCGETVQYGEDASGQLEIRRPSIGQQNTGMGPVTLKCFGVESLEINPIVCQDDSGMGRGEGELLAIRPAQILGFPGRQHIKAMGADQIRDQDRHVLVQVKAEKQRGCCGHRSLGWI